jgi:membrane-associated protease RseP (regulator of RpoE activity)
MTSGVLLQVAFFVALIVVIVIHEAAHFAVAKAFKIKVEEFFVGFGPRLWSTRRGETEYGVKWIPAGGYVKIAGMNPFQPPAEEDLPRTFGAKPIWQRALVIVAGPATHFVLAFVFFAVWLGAIGQPVPQNSPLVNEVVSKLGSAPSPAAIAGLQIGDRIVGIGPFDDPSDIQLVHYTQTHVGESIPFRIRRDGREFEVSMTPVLATVEGKKVGRIGVVLRTIEHRDRAGLMGSLTGGVKLVGDAMAQTVGGIGRIFGPEGIGRLFKLLFTNAPREVSDPASVVGIGRVVGQTVQSGSAWDILYIFALVNVFIGLLNLLPLPPFDGGHLAVLAIEKIRGKTVDMRKLVPISAAVAAFFILFTFAVIYLDIAKPINLAP